MGVGFGVHYGSRILPGLDRSTGPNPARRPSFVFFAAVQDLVRLADASMIARTCPRLSTAQS